MGRGWVGMTKPVPCVFSSLLYIARAERLFSRPPPLPCVWSSLIYIFRQSLISMPPPPLAPISLSFPHDPFSGSWFSCLMPPGMLGDAPVNDGRGSSNSGYSVVAPPGRATSAAVRGGAGGRSQNAFQGALLMAPDL